MKIMTNLIYQFNINIMKNIGRNIFILGKFTLMFFFTIVLALTSSMNIAMNMQGGRKNLWVVTIIAMIAAGGIFVLYFV
tara:strand:+ start:185 stop:421 length:237 start_codon:yes stop_codon:yes gene_type:complete